MGSNRYRILVVNDDGIQAEGIRRLAAAAARLGEVVVAAPKNQCSAMSHRITVFQPLEVKRVVFPVEGVTAFQVDGTPADCVKAALSGLMPERPDFVFSGINYGYNAGADILYEITDQWLLPIAKELMEKDPGQGCIWNVNFPGGSPAQLKGIRRDVKPSAHPFYQDYYERTEEEAGCFYLNPAYVPITQAEPESDIQAVLEHFIAVGAIRNTVL